MASLTPPEGLPDPSLPLSITRDSEFAAANWQTISFADITPALLRPYQIIQDVPRLSAYQQLERMVTAAVRLPTQWQGADAEWASRMMAYEPKILESPITSVLRIRRFQGSLREGRAIVLPFELSLALEHLGRNNPRRWAVDNRRGFTVVYHGLLHTGGKKLGEMVLDTTYSTEVWRRSGGGEHNHVRRTIGEYALKPTAEAVLAERDQLSASESYRAVRYALRHQYRG